MVHLPRHLETVHHWKPEKARDAVHIYGLRKPHSISCADKKTIGCRPCPMDNCLRKISQVSSHLLNFHHLDAKSNLYKTLLEVGRKRRRAHPNGEFRSSPESSDDDMFSHDLCETDGAVFGLEGMEDIEDQEDQIESNRSQIDVPQPSTCIKDTLRQLPTDFLGFATWLKSVDGSQIVAADQYATQVSVISEVVNETKMNIRCFVVSRTFEKVHIALCEKEVVSTCNY